MLLLVRFCVLLSFFSATQVHASSVVLNDVELFQRCYLKLVKSFVPRTASLGKTLNDQIYAKKISGAEGCRLLLEHATLADNGLLKNLTSMEARAILKNLHLMHNSWFQVQRLSKSGAYDATTMVLRDNDEASLYFTQALLREKQAANTVLTSTSTLRSLRVDPSGKNLSRWDRKAVFPRNNTHHPKQMLLAGYSPAANDILSVPVKDEFLVPSGELVGVQAVPAAQISLAIRPLNLSKADVRSTDFNMAMQASAAQFPLYKHHGGGVLGSQMFILKNTNLEIHQVVGAGNDPVSLVPRRLSARIFEDLLCHQLPTLTAADTAVHSVANSGKLQGLYGASEDDIRKMIGHGHAFQGNSSCLRCHDSIDPTALAYKRAIVQITANDVNDNPTLQAKGSPSLLVNILPPKNDSMGFVMRSQPSQMRFRTHKQELRSIPVTSPSDIGRALALEDDFYRCVAKKYYHYFTGINVQLSPMDKNEQHQQVVYSLGAQLKQHQNLRLLIQNIFNSEAFRSRDFKAMKVSAHGK